MESEEDKAKTAAKRAPAVKAAEGSDSEGEGGDQLSALVAARRGGGRGRGSPGAQHHALHKSQGERTVLLARSHIAEVIEGAGLAGEWLAKLEEADRLLRSAEAAMASSRHGAALTVQSSGAVEDLLEDISVEEGLAFTKTDSGRTRDNEVRGWIRQSFTESDAERLQAMSFKLQSLQGGAASSSSAGIGLPASVMDIPAQLQASPRLVQLLDRVGEFDADTVSISRQPEVAGKPLTVLFVHILQKYNLIHQLPDGVCHGGAGCLQTVQEKLFSFLKVVDEKYLDVVYHNSAHAADVMLMMQWFFNSEYMKTNMNHFDHLMGLVAAAIHDMGHNGMNNLFHVKTRSPMALRYNDRSVLENMHVAMAFELMSQNDECNWFDLLSNNFKAHPDEKAVDLRQYMRKGLLSMVLMTDITKHDHLMHQIQGIAGEAGAERSTKKQANLGDMDKKLTVLEVMLHAADVSNPSRPEPIMLDWTRRIVSEFWLQGDEEKRLGLEMSPLCDRQTGMPAVPQGQIGFVNFVVQPLFVHVAALIEEGQVCIEGLQRNVEFWKRKKEEGASFEELFPDTS